MFFRRQTPSTPTLESRLEALRKLGFSIEPLAGARVRALRAGCAAVLEEGRVVERPGVLVNGAIATLVDGGFQKFLQIPGGTRRPALAADLRAVHEFQEDLRQALGLTTLYNESLGTVSNSYVYDRVKDRDRGVPKRPWE